MNKGAEEGKKPVPHKYVTDEPFKLQINGGRFGTANMLHGHGFKLGKNLIIRCTLCPQIIEPPKNMRRNTDESALHKLKYQANIDGAVKLHQKLIEMIVNGEKGSEMYDEVRECCLKH